jgi:hypothetical protein
MDAGNGIRGMLIELASILLKSSIYVAREEIFFIAHYYGRCAAFLPQNRKNCLRSLLANTYRKQKGIKFKRVLWARLICSG